MKHIGLKTMMLCAIALVFLSNCGGNSSCEIFDAYGGDPEIHDKIFVDSHSYNYLPQNQPNMVFSNGVATIICENVRFVDAFTLTETARNTRHTPCGDEFFYHILPIQERGFLYSSTTLPLDIKIVRRKRSEFLPAFDTAKIKLWEDVVVANISNSSFIVPLDKKADTSVTFYPSYSLGSVTYDSVFECRQRTSGGTTAPNVLFYNTSKGILAYKLNNGELWVRQ